MARTMRFNVKTVLIGDFGVGKTTFLNTFINGKFIPEKNQLHMPQEFLYEDKGVCLKIWDTAGMEGHSSLTSSYFRDVQSCLVFFDIAKAETFVNVEGWLDDIWRNIPKNSSCCLFLVGTKRDQQSRDVSYERAESFAEAHNMQYFETSAKDVDSVKDVFHKLLHHFEQELEQSMKASLRKSLVTLDQDNSCEPAVRKCQCCCR